MNYLYTMNIIITCAMITLMNIPSGYTDVYATAARSPGTVSLA